MTASLALSIPTAHGLADETKLTGLDAEDDDRIYAWELLLSADKKGGGSTSLKQEECKMQKYLKAHPELVQDDTMEAQPSEVVMNYSQLVGHTALRTERLSSILKRIHAPRKAVHRPPAAGGSSAAPAVFRAVGKLWMAAKRQRRKRQRMEVTHAVQAGKVATALTADAKENIPYFLQGCTQWYTDDKLEQRESLRHAVLIQLALDKWWLCTEKDPHTGGVNEGTYTALCHKICSALLPANIAKDDISGLIQEDWKKDSKGAPSLDMHPFLDAIFNLADVWCETDELFEYVKFIDTLFVVCFPEKQHQFPAINLKRNIIPKENWDSRLRPLTPIQMYSVNEDSAISKEKQVTYEFPEWSVREPKVDTLKPTSEEHATSQPPQSPKPQNAARTIARQPSFHSSQSARNLRKEVSVQHDSESESDEDSDDEETAWRRCVSETQEQYYKRKAVERMIKRHARAILNARERLEVTVNYTQVFREAMRGLVPDRQLDQLTLKLDDQVRKFLKKSLKKQRKERQETFSGGVSEALRQTCQWNQPKKSVDKRKPSNDGEFCEVYIPLAFTVLPNGIPAYKAPQPEQPIPSPTANATATVAPPASSALAARTSMRFASQRHEPAAALPPRVGTPNRSGQPVKFSIQDIYATSPPTEQKAPYVSDKDQKFHVAAPEAPPLMMPYMSQQPIHVRRKRLKKQRMFSFNNTEQVLQFREAGLGLEEQFPMDVDMEEIEKRVRGNLMNMKQEFRRQKQERAGYDGDEAFSDSSGADLDIPPEVYSSSSSDSLLRSEGSSSSDDENGAHPWPWPGLARWDKSKKRVVKDEKAAPSDAEPPSISLLQTEPEGEPVVKAAMEDTRSGGTSMSAAADEGLASGGSGQLLRIGSEKSKKRKTHRPKAPKVSPTSEPTEPTEPTEPPVVSQPIQMMPDPEPQPAEFHPRPTRVLRIAAKKEPDTKAPRPLPMSPRQKHAPEPSDAPKPPATTKPQSPQRTTHPSSHSPTPSDSKPSHQPDKSAADLQAAALREKQLREEQRRRQEAARLRREEAERLEREQREKQQKKERALVNWGKVRKDVVKKKPEDQMSPNLRKLLEVFTEKIDQMLLVRKMNIALRRARAVFGTDEITCAKNVLFRAFEDWGDWTTDLNFQLPGPFRLTKDLGRHMQQLASVVRQLTEASFTGQTDYRLAQQMLGDVLSPEVLETSLRCQGAGRDAAPVFKVEVITTDGRRIPMNVSKNSLLNLVKEYHAKNHPGLPGQSRATTPNGQEKRGAQIGLLAQLQNQRPPSACEENQCAGGVDDTLSPAIANAQGVDNPMSFTYFGALPLAMGLSSEEGLPDMAPPAVMPSLPMLPAMPSHYTPLRSGANGPRAPSGFSLEQTVIRWRKMLEDLAERDEAALGGQGMPDNMADGRPRSRQNGNGQMSEAMKSNLELLAAVLQGTLQGYSTLLMEFILQAVGLQDPTATFQDINIEVAPSRSRMTPKVAPYVIRRAPPRKDMQMSTIDLNKTEFVAGFLPGDAFESAINDGHAPPSGASKSQAQSPTTRSQGTALHRDSSESHGNPTSPTSRRPMTPSERVPSQGAASSPSSPSGRNALRSPASSNVLQNMKPVIRGQPSAKVTGQLDGYSALQVIPLRQPAAVESQVVPIVEQVDTAHDGTMPCQDLMANAVAGGSHIELEMRSAKPLSPKRIHTIPSQIVVHAAETQPPSAPFPAQQPSQPLESSAFPDDPTLFVQTVAYPTTNPTDAALADGGALSASPTDGKLRGSPTSGNPPASLDCRSLDHSMDDFSVMPQLDSAMSDVTLPPLSSAPSAVVPSSCAVFSAAPSATGPSEQAMASRFEISATAIPSPLGGGLAQQGSALQTHLPAPLSPDPQEPRHTDSCTFTPMSPRLLRPLDASCVFHTATTSRSIPETDGSPMHEIRTPHEDTCQRRKSKLSFQHLHPTSPTSAPRKASRVMTLPSCVDPLQQQAWRRSSKPHQPNSPSEQLAVNSPTVKSMMPPPLHFEPLHDPRQQKAWVPKSLKSQSHRLPRPSLGVRELDAILPCRVSSRRDVVSSADTRVGLGSTKPLPQSGGDTLRPQNTSWQPPQVHHSDAPVELSEIYVSERRLSSSELLERPRSKLASSHTTTKSESLGAAKGLQKSAVHVVADTLGILPSTALPRPSTSHPWEEKCLRMRRKPKGLLDEYIVGTSVLTLPSLAK